MNEFTPLKLPNDGADLHEGRQYLLDPTARAIIIDRFGIRPPKVITCLSKRYAATQIVSTTTNLETGEVKVSSIYNDARPETFQGFNGFKKIVKFDVDLRKVAEHRAAYEDADLVSDILGEGKPATKKEPKEKKSTLERDLDFLSAADC
jgi:hypothetical protein